MPVVPSAAKREAGNVRPRRRANLHYPCNSKRTSCVLAISRRRWVSRDPSIHHCSFQDGKTDRPLRQLEYRPGRWTSESICSPGGNRIETLLPATHGGTGPVDASYLFGVSLTTKQPLRIPRTAMRAFANARLGVVAGATAGAVVPAWAQSNIQIASTPIDEPNPTVATTSHNKQPLSDVLPHMTTTSRVNIERS